MNSITTPMIMQKIMAMAIARKRFSLKYPTIRSPTKAPTMKISPWAKLIRVMMP